MTKYRLCLGILAALGFALQPSQAATFTTIAGYYYSANAANAWVRAIDVTWPNSGSQAGA